MSGRTDPRTASASGNQQNDPTANRAGRHEHTAYLLRDKKVRCQDKRPTEESNSGQVVPLVILYRRRSSTSMSDLALQTDRPRDNAPPTRININIKANMNIKANNTNIYTQTSANHASHPHAVDVIGGVARQRTSGWDNTVW